METDCSKLRSSGLRPSPESSIEALWIRRKKKEESASHHLLDSGSHPVEQLCPKAPQKATQEDHKKASRMKFDELFENLEFLIFVSLSSGLVTSGCSLNVLNLILDSL